jgi:hypothetical protein
MGGFFEYIEHLKEVPENHVPEPDLDDIDVEGSANQVLCSGVRMY